MGESDMDEACEVAMQVASEKAMDACGDEDAIRAQIARMVGIREDEEVDKAYIMSLTPGDDTPEAFSNKWVYCRSLEILDEENVTIHTAVEQAWDEARRMGIAE